MMAQHGGEGKSSYKGKKSDMKLSQHGGEGTSKVTTKKSDKKTNAGMSGTDYCGPGRYL